MTPSIASRACPASIEADVQVVWDPPWNPHMISPEGRAKLGMEE
jgi:metal-sulfur cluster biosynthetic enzyme